MTVVNILDTSVGDSCMTSPEVTPPGHSPVSDTVEHSCGIFLQDTFLRPFLRLLFLWGTLGRWYASLSYELCKWRESRWKNCLKESKTRWERGCVEACFVCVAFSFRAQGGSTRCGGSFGKRNTSGMLHHEGVCQPVYMEMDAHKKVSYVSNDSPTRCL